MTLARYSLIASAVVALTACGNKEETPAAETAAPVSATAPGDVVIKIGHAAPLTGNIAHLGKDNENGVRLAIDELNTENVEIGGKKVKFEMVSEDDQADPKTATTVAQRFVDAKVAGVIGHLNSGTTIPASKIYSDAGIPQISPSATNAAYTQQGFKTAFRVIANDIAQGGALGEFAATTLKAKKVAIIDDRTAYGQGLADEFEKAAKAKGVTVVGREFTTNQATDFMAILTTIKGKKPDIIFYGGMDAQAGPLTQQLKKLGVSAKVIGGDGFQTGEYIKLAGDNAEGQYASQPGMPKDKMPGFGAFNEKYKAKFNTDIQIYAPFTYDATRVMVAAMKKAGSSDPAKYLPEMAKTDYAGVTGPIKFDAKGDILGGNVTVYQVKNGVWEAVATVGGAALAPAAAPAPAPADAAAPAPAEAPK
ncbi:branched-chain amino acid ABC transporter substrate-binding protein [Chitinimonas sp. BJB300]|uniref:branched-chain amino acid ABC transporter substrate-binding protein n=1 Tax=Chitinimonas sp. BJB300 TaxID=1559339 RepID=UPI000C0FDC5E|nr:branched-chain amino acid ABC transporter substrate-binding protein [Chitinimonas sp. BJB300]PHV10273.1 branched chain amino acid ABC transporter substrate-binding protein [Chitinimonas sp. BJB300]TSJ83793.1 branched-chain amino acid ABC transporter substrate-binding protein [Chitinimonas sp. BJB300]